MNKTPIFFLLLLLTLETSAQKQFDATYFETFPTYKEVVEAYYTKNDFGNNDYRNVGFGKKIDGWYVIFKEQGREKSHRKIWNVENKEFVNLKTKGIEKGSETSISNALNNYIRGLEPTFYQQYPVYGYSNYSKDVIELLEDVDSLSELHLDALARSYSLMGTETILPGQVSGIDEKLKYDETFVKDDFKKERLQDYIFYMNKSISTFRKLMVRNSSYQTIVGSIQMKYWNENMAAYLALRFTGQDSVAKQFLVDDLYDEYQLNIAINTLNTCKENGILFTYNDNDTYPLVYIQDKLNIRPDIAIVNVTLLKFGRYINYVKTRYNLPLTYKLEHLTQFKNNVFLVNQNRETIDFQSFLNTTNNDQFLFKDDQSAYLKFPGNLLKINFDKRNLLKQYKADSIDVSNGMFIYLDRQYIYKNYFLVLDIITTNNFVRPIYFSRNSGGIIRDLDLTNKNKLDGFAYRILPVRFYDYDILVDNLLHNFKHVDYTNLNWRQNENRFPLRFHLMAYFKIIDITINTESVEVKELEKDLEMKFPLEDCNYQDLNADFAYYYYKKGDFKTGDKYIKKGIKEVQYFFESIDGKTIDYYTQTDINWYLYIGVRLVETVHQFERIAFNDLETLFEPYTIKYAKK